jgi:hypothetical protein
MSRRDCSTRLTAPMEPLALAMSSVATWLGICGGFKLFSEGEVVFWLLHKVQSRHRVKAVEARLDTPAGRRCDRPASRRSSMLRFVPEARDNIRA